MNKRLQRQKKKKRRAIPVPIASMGDIAFLLIIFFLVCSEVAKDKANLQVALPLSEYVEKIEATVAARVAVDESGEIYFDGARVDSKPRHGRIVVNDNPVLIGKCGFPGELFSGMIDDVMIYHRVLTEREIKQLYMAQGGK